MKTEKMRIDALMRLASRVASLDMEAINLIFNKIEEVHSVIIDCTSEVKK